MNATPQPPSSQPPKRGRNFRRSVLGGLAVVLPPLLTLAVFVWVGNTINFYVLQPIKGSVESMLVWRMADVRDTLPNAKPAPDDPTVFVTPEGSYKLLPRGQYVPNDVYQEVRTQVGADPSGTEIYERYVETKYLQPHLVVPIFLCVFVLLLYFVGRFIAMGLGSVLWGQVEGLLNRLPLISNVYASVKQVTDFLFTESELEYTRVVAVQYPCKDVWSIGFVTGEGLRQISQLVQEPVLSVLIPTSPMPMTGFTAIFRKSDAVDLDLTIEQAFQYIISCGVVLPTHQIGRTAANKALDLLGARGEQTAS